MNKKIKKSMSLIIAFLVTFTLPSFAKDMDLDDFVFVEVNNITIRAGSSSQTTRNRDNSIEFKDIDALYELYYIAQQGMVLEDITIEISAPIAYFINNSYIYEHIECLQYGYILVFISAYDLVYILNENNLDLCSDFYYIARVMPRFSIFAQIQPFFSSWNVYGFLITNLTPNWATMNVTSSGMRTNNTVYSSSAVSMIFGHGTDLVVGYTSYPQHPVMILNTTFVFVISNGHTATSFVSLPNPFITPFSITDCE